jgi:hypothetical protein
MSKIVALASNDLDSRGGRGRAVARPAGARASSQGGARRVEFDGSPLGAKGGETTVETPGWGAERDRFAVKVTGGTNVIEIVRR